MGYETQTKDTILQRMLDASPSDIDKREGSVTKDLLAPPAIELETAYLELDTVLDKGFADTAFGEFLDKRVADVGLSRKPSEKSVGTVLFTGNDGTEVPTGTEVSTNGELPIYFVTTSATTITGGTASAPVEAKEAGASGNVATNTVVLTTGNITGITSVTNPSAFEGGVDEETDEALLKRYYERVQRPVTSGNIYHYRTWALEVTGVRDVRVYPVWNGPLSVKVVILADTGVPSQTLVDTVKTHIESERPVGADVTVVGAVDYGIDVVATLTLASGATVSDVKPLFEATVSEYFKELAFTDPIVRITQIQKILLDIPQIVDFTGLTLNGGTGNIEITGDAIPVLRTVTLNVA